jgi:CHAD domain-containing protein
MAPLRDRASIPPQAAHNSTVQPTAGRTIKLMVGDPFRFPAFPGTPLKRRLLTSTYYDTARHDLARGGITLCHRLENGTHTWRLTLPLNHDQQDIEIVAQDTLPVVFLDLLVLHLNQSPLVPMATLRTRRTGVRVHRGGSSIANITLDHVAVARNGKVTQRFRELGIEQLDGADAALCAIERQLRRAGADDHGGRPELFHALAPAAPESDAQPGRDAPVLEHVTAAFARHAWWLTAHDPGTRLGQHPESLHQMRVAVRQFRAVLRAATPLLHREWAEPLQEELAWLSRVLGPARDLDVQLTYLSQEAATFGPRDRRSLDRFMGHLVAERNKVQEVLLRELKSPRYSNLIARLRTAAQRPEVVSSPVTLQDLATRAFKKLRKAIRRAGAAPNGATLHDIRIKTKRSRYVAALAQPVVGKPATRFIEQARVVQDVMGIHQDARQAEVHVQAFLKHSTGRRAAFVAGRMIERQRARRTEAKAGMQKLWKRLLKRGKRAWL